MPEPFAPSDPPDAPLAESSLPSWQRLFKERRTWAVKLSEQSDGMLGRVLQTDAEVLVIRRATAVAVDSVRQHLATAFQTYGNAKTWARDVLKSTESTRVGWDRTMQRYAAVPVDGQLGGFFKGADGTTTESSSLKSLATAGRQRSLWNQAQEVADGLQKRLARLERQSDEVRRQGNELVGHFNRDFNALAGDVQQPAAELAEEVSVVVKKINADYEATLTLPNSSRSLTTAMKTATVHAQEFLPSLMGILADTDQLLRATLRRKNAAMDQAVAHLRRIATIQSAIAAFKPEVDAFELAPDDEAALDAVAHVQRLPAAYASLLVEAVRRQEWSGKMTADSAALAEEMAVHKDDEERRRRKWLRSVREFLSEAAQETKALGIEVNVRTSDQSWPALTRDDVEQYLAALREAGGFEAALKEAEELVKSLDAPTKQQLRHANAQFKNGSIHSAAYGRNSLLLRGDDEFIQALQVDKTRLEERLKGSESRIRKLEDLLHRQSQMQQRPIASRPSSSGLDRFSTSPVLPSAAMIAHKPSDADMRRPSMGSRPVSATFGTNDKALLQKVVYLEEELDVERAKAARLQEHASSSAKEHAELRQQVQETTSTKQDLMDNLEAQKLEFESERRLFQDENRELKMRLEEVEEELDRTVEGHENARSELERLRQGFESESSSAKRDAAAKVKAAEERAMSLQDKLDQQETLLSDLRLEQENINGTQAEAQLALQAAHIQLSPEVPTPARLIDLASAIETVSQRASDHLRELRLALDNAQTEKAAAEDRMKRQDDEHRTLQGTLVAAQSGASSLQKELGAEQVRFQSISKELEGRLQELAHLHAQMEDRATSPDVADALKGQLASEEQKVENLQFELAMAKSAADQSEKELSGLREQIESLQSLSYASSNRLQRKSERAGQVTLHLFTQVDRMTRVLENIGYSVSRQDGEMVIQRVPRSAAVASTTLAEPQTPSAITPGLQPLPHDRSLPNYLHWATVEDDARAGEDFETFMHETQAFDLDAFSEAVVKRVKDIEHIARKWQKEAKAYREKFHRAQLDGQQKIAFRSFREGDLALFLPTRNQTPQRPWAAFNVGAPHYFLREQDSHKLQARDFLLARISKVEERVVDLGKDGTNSIAHASGEGHAAKSDDHAHSVDEYNPFGLSDGLRWYFLDAAEDKLGAPTTPGPGKTTVASAHVDAAGSIGRKLEAGGEDGGGVLTKTLAKSLDSRRSSANSRRSVPNGGGGAALNANPTVAAEVQATPSAPSQEQQPHTEEAAPKPLPMPRAMGAEDQDVRKDQLLGP